MSKNTGINETARKIQFDHRRYRLGDHPLTQEQGLKDILDTLANIKDPKELDHALFLLENPTAQPRQ